MEIKKPISWDQANALLFAVAAVLEPVDKDKLYYKVHIARLGDDPRAVVVETLTYIAMQLG
jgi:hypothetical protein